MRLRRASLCLLLLAAGCGSPPPRRPTEPWPWLAPPPPAPTNARPSSTAGPAPRPSAAELPPAQQRIDVDVEDVDLAELCAQIGRRVGRTIEVDPNVKERITVSLRDISWREAVDVIARMARTEVVEQEGRLTLAQP